MTMDEHVDCDRQLNEAEDRILKLKERIKELEEGDYIRHKHNCNMGEYNSILIGKGCTCGLSEALEG